MRVTIASSKFSKISFTSSYKLSFEDKTQVRAFSTTFKISFSYIRQLKVKTKDTKIRGQDYKMTFTNESFDLFVFMIIPNIITNPVPRVSKT